MSKEKAKRKPTGLYEVGYGKPPVHSRLPKGTSGNPSGRPPKRVQQPSADELVLEVCHEVMSVTVGGETKRMPMIKANLLAIRAKALKGDGPSMRALQKRYDDAAARAGAIDDGFLRAAYNLQRDLMVEKVELQRRGESTKGMDLQPDDVLIDVASGEATILRPGLPVLPPPRRDHGSRSGSKRRDRRVRAKGKGDCRFKLP